ncbi:MAG TPA: VWA domain-containing protein [Vicinamibacterales bacterium]|jgi:Ca-activated chloride channel family protein
MGSLLRLAGFTALGVCALVLATAPAPAAQQPPVFRGTTEAVRVFVTVTDRDGKLVTSLTKDDFELRDDGKPQPITQFDNSPQPIRLIVMLDVSTSMQGNLPLLRASADQLFARLRPDDVARVGTFGKDVEISSEFTHDANQLRAALPTYIAQDAATPLWRGIDQAITGFQDGGDERAVILVLSDGKDTSSLTVGHPVSQGEVIDRARRQDVMIYAIGMRSRGPRPPMGGPIGPGGLQGMLLADMPDPGLARVAEESGGGYIEVRFGQDLGAAFAAVADELHTQYLLGFAPTKRDGKTHDINVKIAKGGMKARARKSYVAPKGT